MENPYASPTPTNLFGDLHPKSPPPPGGARERGLVGHVRILGILLMVHGVFALLCGLMFAGMAILFPMIFVMDPPPRGAPNAPPPEAIGWFIGAIYGGIGFVTLLAGGLQIYAGYKTYLFRQRKLGILSVILGAGASLSCYCSITAIGLLIYGLIVYLDNSVKQAFELGDQGYAPDQIDALFNPYSAR